MEFAGFCNGNYIMVQKYRKLCNSLNNPYLYQNYRLNIMLKEDI